MEIKVKAHDERSLRIVIGGASPTFVNALRRTILSDVPKMAIEDVEFHLGPIRAEDGREYESVTPLFDEIIAHRLGLIPLPTDLELYRFRASCEACHGEGCPQCTIIYAINKKGPGVVHSSDLEPIGDPKLKPVDPRIPIVKLGDGQAMLVYATAVLGLGRDHAKWQAASGVTYRYYPTLSVKGREVREGLEAYFCGEHAGRVEDEGEAVFPEVVKCPNCKAANLIAEGQLELGGDATRFVFSFETDGSLTARDVLLKGAEILEGKFSSLSGAFENVE
jgi:DNA-directed RNA polymerase subunit D